MKIAIASQNFRTITPHAGKARRFLLFVAEAGRPPEEIGRLDLPINMSMHEFAGGSHPLDEADVLIAGSAGPGFIAKMRARGVAAVTTSETDPVTAITKYLAGTLASALPDGDGCGCDCGHH